MFKKFWLTLLFFAVALMVGASENSLVKILPKNAMLVISGDLNALYQLPEVKNYIQQEQQLQVLQKQHNFQISDLDALVIASPLPGQIEKMVALLSFKKPLKTALLLNLNQPGTDLKVEQVTVQQRPMLKATSISKHQQVLIEQYNPTTWLIVEPANYAVLTKQLQLKTASFRFPPHLKGVARFCVRTPQEMQAQSFKLLYGSVNLTGPQHHDMLWRISLIFSSTEKANQIKMQIPAFYTMFVSMFAANQPEVSNGLIQALKVNGQDHQVDFELHLTEKLMKAAAPLWQDYQKNRANRQLNRAPRPNRTAR